MKAMLCNTAVVPMFELLRKKKTGQLNRGEIEAMLEHADYQFEFRRYEDRVAPRDFAEYLLNFESLDVSQIKNYDLRNHHRYWLDLYENLDWFEKETEAFFRRFDTTVIDEARQIAVSGFPTSCHFQDCKIIFTCGIGQSFGYAHENGMHFDIMQLLRHYADENFKLMIAHEIHHLFFLDNVPFDETNLEGYFLQWFAIEGLAIKFTGNAQGVLSQKLHPEQLADLGLDDTSIAYANSRFNTNFAMFRKHLAQIRSGEISTVEGVRNLLVNYWFDLYTDEQSRDEVPQLKQPKLYAFGNDLWGTFYDVYGMDELYETLTHPETFVEKFNGAIRTLGREEYLLVSQKA